MKSETFRRIVFLCVAVLAVLLLQSNHADWDHFLSFFEAERRSWLLDWKPPFWTYQLCGGVTRAGDPQSFGLSPLFLPIILFGSFWGAKILALGSVVLGYLCFARILDLLDPVRDENSRLIHRSVSVFLNFGGIVIWHLHAGQVTFALMPFTFVPAYFLLRGVRIGWDRWTVLGFFASLFAYLTAGFYHAAVFFALPAVALLAAALLIYRVRTRRLRAFFAASTRRRLAILVAVAVCAFVLSSFRWMEVLRHQITFPRQLTEPERELSTVPRLAAYFLLPVWRLQFVGRLMWGPWMVWEYAAFSALPYLIGALALARLRLGRLPKGRVGPWGIELLIVSLIALFLSMGDASPVPLHAWLNQHVYHQSVRAVGRYENLLLVCLAILTIRMLVKFTELRSFYVKFLIPTGLALTLINLFTMIHLGNFSHLREIVSWPNVAAAEMHTVGLVKTRDWLDSYMYRAVLAGGIILNCYEPLNRMTRIAAEGQLAKVLSFPPGSAARDLLVVGKAPVSEACRDSAYATQNEIRFDRDRCPPDLCFLLNDLNPYRPVPLVWRPERGLYCVKGII